MRTSSAIRSALQALVLALLGTASGSALAVEPEILLVPDSGAPGSEVGVSGTGFPPFSTVLVVFSQADDQVVGFAGTDDEGRFTVLVAVPEDALPGPALFIAGNTLASAEAEFLVSGSEPTGDPRGPPADKVAVCEIVYILERVVNRVFTTDEDFEFVHGSRVQGGPGPKDKTLEVEAKVREVTRLAEEIGRERLPKASFPVVRHVGALIWVARPERRFLGGVLASKDTRVDCPDSVLLEFTDENGTQVDLKDQFGAKLGRMEVTYRLIVREVSEE